MADGGALISLGELSRPATVLIEKVSDAVGGIAKPWQIKRTARAEADAEVIRAEARIQISEIERRALERMVREEGQKQENIESITAKAIPHLRDEARPEGVEKDWLSNFFDRCRLTSDEEMQTLWARILAGEANAPGSYSKKTIEVVNTLDKRDANLFMKLCTFCWMIGDLTPIIHDSKGEIYTNAGINFSTLTHLDSIGLIAFDNVAGYVRSGFEKYVTVFYYGTPITLEFPVGEKKMKLGRVLFTQAGAELAPIAGSARSGDFFQYVLDRWLAQGYILSSPVAGHIA